MLSRHEFHDRKPAGTHPPDPGLPPVVAPADRFRIRSALAAGASLAALWQGFHWTDPASWVIGAPAVIGGAIAAGCLHAASGPRVRLAGIPGLAAHVTSGILRGAVDVGIRSLQPGSLNPGFVTYRTTLPEGAPRRLFAILITMMPGTLTVRLDNDRLLVHALDLCLEVTLDLQALERRIAAAFREQSTGDEE